MTRWWPARSPRPLVLLVLCLSLAAAGCEQLNDQGQRVALDALGIDAGPQPGSVTVSGQFLRAPIAHMNTGGGSGGGGGGATGASWKTVSGSGPSVPAALGEVQRSVALALNLGQVGAVLVGDTLARRGILPELESLLRNPDVGEITQVTVATDSAQELLTKGETDEVGIRLREFPELRDGTRVGVLANPLWHFLSQSLGVEGASYAPVFAPDPGGYGLRYAGTGLFRSGALVDVLDPTSAQPLVWMIRRTQYGNTSVSVGGRQFSLEVRRCVMRLDLTEPERPVVRLFMRVRVAAASGGLLPTEGTGLEDQLAPVFAARALTVIDRLQADGTDVLGVGERLRERGELPAGPWSRNFPKLQVSVSVRVQAELGKAR